MLKIYDVHDYVSIDGARWRELDVTGYRATDEEPQDTIILNNISFDEVRSYLLTHRVCGLCNDCTPFRHKPLVCVKYWDAWDYVDYKHFTTLSYKREFVERKDVTFEWMTKHLSADQLIQYLKERGITACPMNF